MAKAKATTQKINAVTKRLVGHYRAQKERKAKLEKERNEFFELLTELVKGTQVLAQKTVEIPEYWYGDARAYLTKWHADWRLIEFDIEQDEMGEVVKVTAILEEDPECKAATWVNEKIGIFFAKQVRAGQITLDDEWLMEEDPWLYNDLLQLVFQIKPMDEWSTEEAVAAERYIYRERSKPALQQPRQATPEELGSGG
jgi:hypothetical protein